MAPFAKPTIVAAVITALGVWLGVSPSAHDQTPKAAPAHVRPQIDATSNAEALRMRAAVKTLARQTAAGARCDPGQRSARYTACVVPALRHAGIGGRMGATVLNVVIAGVPYGLCREYLIGLQAAMEGA